VFELLLRNDRVEIGDLVIFTKGDLDGVSGSTNAMKILPVTQAK
jgi:pyruvate kinase